MSYYIGYINCSYCGSKLHTTKYCPKTYQGSENRVKLHCGYCGSKKHNKDGCPKKWSGPNPEVILD